MTPVLLKHVFRLGAWVIPLAALAAVFLAGGDYGLAVLIAALLALLDGAGIIYFVGRLLAEGEPAKKKAVFSILLVLKFVAVAVSLWVALNLLPGVGIVFGLAVGLLTVVVGANQGSTSSEGQALMERLSTGIEKELTDKNEPA